MQSGEPPPEPLGPPPSPEPRVYSPDRRWYWDGSAWQPAGGPEAFGAPVPAAPYPGGPYPAAPYPAAPYPVTPPVAPYAVSPKSPGIALLVSFFIPGVGSMMNGETGKGLAILIGYLASWVLFWLLLVVVIGLVFLPVALGLWIWGMADAYTGAQRWNRAHGIVS